MLFAHSLAVKLGFSSLQIELRPWSVMRLNGVSVVILGTRWYQIAIEIRRIIALLGYLTLIDTFFLIYYVHRLYMRIILWSDYRAWITCIRYQSANLGLFIGRWLLTCGVLSVV